MSFSVGAIRGTDGGARGIVDHRLARRMLISEVTYVFGHGLQAQGHCVSTAEQMRRIEARSTEASAYVVEACVECRWNHLLRILPVGGT
jgi:hypothetical protein